MLFLIAVAVLIVLWTAFVAASVAWHEKRFPGKYLAQFAGACALLIWVAFA